MIEVGNIVTLDNGTEYLLLEELTKNDTRYIYSVRVLEDETATDEFLIYEAIVNGEEEFLKVVDDRVLYDELIEEFKDVVADKVLAGDYEEMEEVAE